MWVKSLGQEDPLEEGMTTHFSTPAWRIPWTQEPGGLWSIGSQRVGHNWSDSCTPKWKEKMKVLVAQLCLTFCNPMKCSQPGSFVHEILHFLLQDIFPTQGLIMGVLHCRWFLYHLSHQENSAVSALRERTVFCTSHFPSS